MIQFIYQPKSGDRVFAQNEGNTIQVVRWSNGCRHVYGGIMFEFNAASQGLYWRGQAVRMATMLVAKVGGIAWDTQGVISVVVPHQHAKMVLMWMSAAAKVSGAQLRTEQIVEAHARMLLSGWEPEAETMDPSWCSDRSKPVYKIKAWVDDPWVDDHRDSKGLPEETRKWVVRFEDEEGVVLGSQTAPHDWGPPQTRSMSVEILETDPNCNAC